MNKLKTGVLIAMATVICSAFTVGCGSETIAPPAPDTEKNEIYGEYGEVKLAFPAVSDLHFGSVCDEQVRDYYPKALAKSLEVTGNNIDTVVISGDFTEGFLENYDTLIQYTIDGVGSKTPMVVSYGNHEGNDKHYQYIQKFGKPIDNVTEVNGYNFVVIGAHANDTYTAEQAQWLDGQLSAMTKADPDKPVFVVVHHPVYGTHSPNSGNTELQSTLEKYKQAFVLCGHEHQKFSDESLWKGEYISFRNSYMRNETEGQYALIRVTDKNYVIIEQYSVPYQGEATHIEGKDWIINLNEFYKGN